MNGIGGEAVPGSGSARRRGFVLGMSVLVVLALGAGAALAGRTVTVGASSNGKSLKLEKGDRLVVRLRGNPSTGYRWDLVGLPGSLRRTGSSFEQSKSTPPMVGQGGTFVFRFVAKPGKGTLRLVYHRPWQKSTPPLRTFALRVSAS